MQDHTHSLARRAEFAGCQMSKLLLRIFGRDLDCHYIVLISASE